MEHSLTVTKPPPLFLDRLGSGSGLGQPPYTGNDRVEIQSVDMNFVGGSPNPTKCHDVGERKWID